LSGPIVFQLVLFLSLLTKPNLATNGWKVNDLSLFNKIINLNKILKYFLTATKVQSKDKQMMCEIPSKLQNFSLFYTNKKYVMNLIPLFLSPSSLLSFAMQSW
jgi:hypothetical protein